MGFKSPVNSLPRLYAVVDSQHIGLSVSEVKVKFNRENSEKQFVSGGLVQMFGHVRCDLPRRSVWVTVNKRSRPQSEWRLQASMDRLLQYSWVSGLPIHLNIEGFSFYNLPMSSSEVTPSAHWLFCPKLGTTLLPLLEVGTSLTSVLVFSCLLT